MKFLPLLELHLTHPYYTDRRCPDFSIEPTPETQRLLHNYRGVLKPLPDGMRILSEAAASGEPFIPWPTGLILTFWLRLQNSDFALFTDIAELTQVAAPLYSNAGLSAGRPLQLTLTSRRAWRTEPLMVSQPAQAERFALAGRPLAGLQPADFSVEGLGQVARPASYDPTAKIITLKTQTARRDDPFRITYETAPPHQRGVFAEVELHHNDSWPALATGPGQFELAFTAKAARWVYYIISDKADTRFHIEDKGTAPLIFGDNYRTDLNQQSDPADALALALAAQYPEMQRLRFVSDQPVLCQQQARKAIQLRLNGQQVLEALPNPSLRNYAALTINGGGQKEEVLFQVVKYFTHRNYSG